MTQIEPATDDSTDATPEVASAPSSVELIKLASHRLRGGLHDAVVSETPNFDDDDTVLLKFHGIYQQDDRDQRVKRGEPRARAWQAMIRLTIPGGTLSPDQYLALDTDNAFDLSGYAGGLVAVPRGGKILGYNLLAGGGFGMTHNKANTFARIATTIAFVEPPHAVAAVRAVCELYRDAGNRADRRHARLKYLIEQWGAERFTEELRARVPFTLHPPSEVPDPQQRDFLGVHEQGDGRFFAGVFVQSGRVADRDGERTRSAFLEIVATMRPGVRLTPMQSVLFTDLTESDVVTLQRILVAHGVRGEGELSNTVRYSMACPALPTCGLALADAERALPGLLEDLERELTRLHAGTVPLTVRMTGCPNGCARPYNADIGFVGRRPGVYHVFVGGGLRGDRLADLFASDVKIDQLVPTLRPLLERFASERHEDEGLGDFYQRVVGNVTPRRLLTGRETPTGGLFQSAT